MQYWLMKSEADCYSIDDLKKDKKTPWTEVRNYQARNFMRDMKVGDKVLFYHSNGGTHTGVVGEAAVSAESKTDPTQFDKNSEYYDSKATKDSPRWDCVDVAFKKKFRRPILLSDLKEKKFFHDMRILQKGNRLSITPVSRKHFEKIIELGK